MWVSGLPVEARQACWHGALGSAACGLELAADVSATVYYSLLRDV